MRVIVVAAAGCVLVVALLAASWVAYRGWESRQRQTHGFDIFHGQADLPGRLAGHVMLLPPQASRCVNCHDSRDRTPSAGAGRAAPAPATPFAALLDRRWLSSPRSRHGGPPTTYDAASLCTLLRAGVDPAHVVISTVMPRYDASGRQCAALKAYLESR